MTGLTHRTVILAFLPLATVLSGCMHPGMYNTYPRYQQPMYAPQTLGHGNPGSLVIPESDAPPYEPGSGSTYDDDPGDDFNRSNDPPFYTPDDSDTVPLPSDRSRRTFDSELDGSTSIQPHNNQRLADAAQPNGKSIELASYSSVPAEYGFDTADYSWLRGRLHYSARRDQWLVQYSLAANDMFRGTLLLDVTPQQLRDLRDGDPVDVQGFVDPDVDAQGTPVYRVEMIRPMATRIADER